MLRVRPQVNSGRTMCVHGAVKIYSVVTHSRPTKTTATLPVPGWPGYPGQEFLLGQRAKKFFS